MHLFLCSPISHSSPTSTILNLVCILQVHVYHIHLSINNVCFWYVGIQNSINFIMLVIFFSKYWLEIYLVAIFKSGYSILTAIEYYESENESHSVMSDSL